MRLFRYWRGLPLFEHELELSYHMCVQWKNWDPRSNKSFPRVEKQWSKMNNFHSCPPNNFLFYFIFCKFQGSNKETRIGPLKTRCHMSRNTPSFGIGFGEYPYFFFFLFYWPVFIFAKKHFSVFFSICTYSTTGKNQKHFLFSLSIKKSQFFRIRGSINPGIFGFLFVTR